MVVSNEPGHYEEGKFGIRIENLLLVQDFKHPEDEELDRRGFYCMTVIPYSTKLLKMDLLNRDNIEFINAYHARCLHEVSPILQKHGWDLGLKWLEKRCQPIRN